MKWKMTSLEKIIEKPVSGEWGNETGDGQDGVKVIRSTNFTNEGRLNLDSGIARRSITIRKVEQKCLKRGDLIIEKSGGSPNQPVGRVIYFDMDGTYLTSNFTSILRAKGDVFPKYLLYLLFAHHQLGTTLKYQNKTTGIINLQLKRYVKELQIPLPPLPVQKRIAAILDAADAYRQKTKALLEKYDELAQSIFLDMFGDPVRNEKGWDVKKLGEVIEEGPINGLYKSSKYYGRGNPIIRIDSFYNDVVKVHELRNVEVNESELRRFEVFEGDILVNRVNSRSHLGKVGLVPKLNKRTVYESNMMRIKFDSSTTPTFIMHIMSHPYVKSQILIRCKDAVNQSSINQEDVKGISIPVPPVEIQNSFAKKISLVNDQINNTKNQLNKSTVLFQSLLQRAFKGELVV